MTWVLSLVRKILWRREWQPTPVFLPGEFHGQRSLTGYSPCDCEESDMTERLTHRHTDTDTHTHTDTHTPMKWSCTDSQWLLHLLSCSLSPASKWDLDWGGSYNFLETYSIPLGAQPLSMAAFPKVWFLDQTVFLEKGRFAGQIPPSASIVSSNQLPTRS